MDQHNQNNDFTYYIFLLMDWTQNQYPVWQDYKVQIKLMFGGQDRVIILTDKTTKTTIYDAMNF